MSLPIADMTSGDFAIEHLHAPTAQYLDQRLFHQFDASMEMTVKSIQRKLSLPNCAKTQCLRLIILAA